MASPFTSILNTNYVPSELEIQDIKRFLEAPELALSSIRVQIEQHEAILQELRVKRDLLQSTVDDHRTIISPARRLPDDTLREIFVRCLPEDHNATMYAGDAPILICHICSRWREVALTTPILWASLHVPICAMPKGWTQNGSLEKQLCDRDERVKTWIERSGALSLSLSFAPPYERHPSIPSCVDLRRVLCILNPVLQRCIEVDIRCAGTPEDVSTAFDIPEWKDRHPFLEAQKVRLQLDPVGGYGAWTDSLEQQADNILRKFGVSRSKKLTSLALYSLDLHRRAKFLTQYASFSQLQVLRLQSQDPSDLESWPPRQMYDQLLIFQILQQCPKLVIFDANVGFYDVDHSQIGHQNGGMIIHNNLQHLSLHCSISHGPFLPTLFKYCEWPAMKSLRLRAWQSFTWTKECSDRICAVPPLIQAVVGQSLASLTLNCGFWVIDDFPDFPNLIQLHLDYYGNDMLTRKDYFDRRDEAPHGKTASGILAALTPSAIGTPPHSCPLLRYLKWEGNTHFSDESLSDLLLARASSPHSSGPFKQVHIEFNYGRNTEKIVERCAPLVEGGLDLYLTHMEREPQRNTLPNPLVAKAGLSVQPNVFALGWDQVARKSPSFSPSVSLIG